MQCPGGSPDRALDPQTGSLGCQAVRGFQGCHRHCWQGGQSWGSPAWQRGTSQGGGHESYSTGSENCLSWKRASCSYSYDWDSALRNFHEVMLQKVLLHVQLLPLQGVQTGTEPSREAWVRRSRGDGWEALAGHPWQTGMLHLPGPRRDPCARTEPLLLAASAGGCRSPRRFARAWHTTDRTSLAGMQPGDQVPQREFPRPYLD